MNGRAAHALAGREQNAMRAAQGRTHEPWKDEEPPTALLRGALVPLSGWALYLRSVMQAGALVGLAV